MGGGLCWDPLCPLGARGWEALWSFPVPTQDTARHPLVFNEQPPSLPGGTDRSWGLWGRWRRGACLWRVGVQLDAPGSGAPGAAGGVPGGSEALLATPVGAASSRESTLNGFDQPGRGEPPISAPIKSTPGRARGLIAQSERRRQKS